MRFVQPCSQQELVNLYRGAAVHVLPSWFETTGLVSLEAALSGCAVVTTDRGYARDYFGDLAHYCDPSDADSIRQAVQRALADGHQPELELLVRERYSWGAVARATVAAYEAATQSASVGD